MRHEDYQKLLEAHLRSVSDSFLLDRLSRLAQSIHFEANELRDALDGKNGRGNTPPERMRYLRRSLAWGGVPFGSVLDELQWRGILFPSTEARDAERYRLQTLLATPDVADQAEEDAQS